MMKTGKPALQGAIASGSSVDSSLAYPNSSLKISPCPAISQAKSKLNRFKITTSLLKQSSSSASPRPPEASNGLPNGLLPLASSDSCSQMSRQWRNLPKDISDFGMFHKLHWGSTDVKGGTGEPSREMYCLSEEVGDSGGSDTDDQSKEAADAAKTDKELPGRKRKDEAPETKEVSSMKGSVDKNEERKTAEGNKDPLCTDSAADGCLLGSAREDANDEK